MTALSFVVVPADETLPLESLTLEIQEGENIEVLLEQRATSFLGDSIKLAPLLLPSGDGDAGLYVYSIVPESGQQLARNVRATRLAMACGNLSTRFHGDVLLFRSRGGRGYQNLVIDELYGAACVSPDLRPEIQATLRAEQDFELSIPVPEWVANAAQQNYHDSVSISRLVSVMNPSVDVDESDESSSSGSSSEDDDSALDGGGKNMKNESVPDDTDRGKDFVARASLCLHCRGPCDFLCPDCEGAYFCKEPRQCRQIG